MTREHLRAVSEGEQPTERAEPPTLIEAVESGDVLQMLLAQRRLIVDKLANAGDNTAPQLNNELNKLHGLIATEEKRRAAEEHEERQRGDNHRGDRRTFRASAI
ncbi:hypothetical protein [Isoptericola aurantiacus]|uniref:hypothetical protein n=1 Tax=Isoptericola aurantiacus TaxID=3377839 RepID=UPI00383BC605